MSTSLSLAKKANSNVTALARMVKIIPKKKDINEGFYRIPVLILSFNMDVLFKENEQEKLVYDDYLSSFNVLLRKDNYVCIHHRNIQRAAIEMFKIKHKLCPDIVQSLFCQREGKRSRASFLRPQINSVYNGEQSFRSFGPIVWDIMLPGDIWSHTMGPNGLKD